MVNRRGIQDHAVRFPLVFADEYIFEDQGRFGNHQPGFFLNFASSGMLRMLIALYSSTGYLPRGGIYRFHQQNLAMFVPYQNFDAQGLRPGDLPPDFPQDVSESEESREHLFAGHAVERLPQDIGMAAVPTSLFDQMRNDPT